MHVTRVLPTVAQLVTRALGNTPFLAEISVEIAENEPYNLTICAELAAELAAESWERDHDALVGVTISHALTAEVAVALADHGRTLHAEHEATLYDTNARMELFIGTAARLRRDIAEARLPGVRLDGIAEDIGACVAKLQVALGPVETAIDRLETVKSLRLAIVGSGFVAKLLPGRARTV
jgi:hypothetical protein